MNEQKLTLKEKIAKNRKAGWIAAAIMTVLMLIMLVAYIVTDGTYGLDLNDGGTEIAVSDVGMLE